MSDSELQARLSLLLLFWILYFLVHSLLASDTIRTRLMRWLPLPGRRYRLFYNLVAIGLLVPPLMVLHDTPWPSLWRWQGAGRWLADGLALLAAAGFFWTLRYYDGREFLGIGEARKDHPPLILSPLHRHVRHPWYALGLVILWTRSMDLGMAATAVLATLYLAIGSRLEERRLSRRLGDVYRIYMQRVPGLLPIPGRSLSREEAESLVARSRCGTASTQGE